MIIINRLNIGFDKNDTKWASTRAYRKSGTREPGALGGARDPGHQNFKVGHETWDH